MYTTGSFLDYSPKGIGFLKHSPKFPASLTCRAFLSFMPHLKQLRFLFNSPKQLERLAQ
jgi:hypothetical protein